MIGAVHLKNGVRFACVAAMALCAMASPARAGDSEATDAQVAVITRGEFIKIEDLHFGQIASGSTAGTVILAPDGTRTRTGGVTLIGSLHHPAQFAGRRLVGVGLPVLISVGSSTITLTGPGAPMQVSLFRGNTNPSQPFTTTPSIMLVQDGANGTFQINVGATLNVGANQTPGTYTGNWSINVDFL